MKKILTLIFALIAMISSGSAQDSEPDYLCFEVKAGTTISLVKNGNANPNIQYCFNKKAWMNFSKLTVQNDCCIYFKGVNPNGFNASTTNYSSFKVTKEFKCSGNIMTLIDGEGKTKTISHGSCFYRLFYDCPMITAPDLPATILKESCYDEMFYGCTRLTTAPVLPATSLPNCCYKNMFYGCTSLIKAPELPVKIMRQGCCENMFYGCTSLTAAPVLPAETMGESCYKKMFYGCTGLTTAPELPATTLASNCYENMFSGCTSLTSAPVLPATSLALRCYNSMFSGCTSLTVAPELPATTLASSCYNHMFGGCTSLTNAPNLPATTLADLCYYNMFSGCTSLTIAPNLPATTLADCCYYNMFSGCTSLTTAPNLPATTLADYCYYNMFSGCTSLTTAPNLPATTLTYSCYYNMFRGCTSLTIAPELPATTLAESCYYNMFSGCISLTIAPKLPATTLAGSCYHSMFMNCTWLATAPELPATTLASSCYCHMFDGCTSLTAVPELPATTLADCCYEYMFDRCTSLAIAPELPATTLACRCYYNMFRDCTSLTTAPDLPAKTLVQKCYGSMFSNCSKLQSISVGFDSWTEQCLDNWMLHVSNKGTFFCSSDLPQTRGPSYIPLGWVAGSKTKNYSIICSPNEFVTADKTSVKYDEKVNFTIVDRSVDGYKLDKVLINDKEVVILNYAGSFEMIDYMSDVTINAVYSKEPDYLYFDVKEGTKIGVETTNTINLMYSFDKKTWDDFSEITVESDCRVYFKGVNSQGLKGTIFKSSEPFACGGNIMTLIDGKGETTIIPANECFAGLFEHSPITTAPKLPATTLTESCYAGMFYMCTRLTEAPELPATIMAERCYYRMFAECRSLTCAPELPATTVAYFCYYEMFCDCLKLTTAPKELPALSLAPWCYYSMFGACPITTAPDLPAVTLAEGCYERMFHCCSKLTTAPRKLPATTLPQSCYREMFSDCPSLTIAPDISAVSSGNWCCYQMFMGCSRLISAPKLPATTLSERCYASMFSGCTRLIVAPELPATTLSERCYASMFSGCTSLIMAPELPATTLSKECYANMFSGCTSLITAPELPATTLAYGCYVGMFYGCEKLNYICVNFEQWDTEVFYLGDWMKGVNETGTFICPKKLPKKYGCWYIPEGWIVKSLYCITTSFPDDITLSSNEAFTGDEITITVKQKENSKSLLFIDGEQVSLSNGKYVYTMTDKDVDVEVVYKNHCINNLTPNEITVSADYANAGEEIIVTFAQKDYYVPHIYMDATEGIINNKQCVFTMPDKDVQIKIVYTPTPYAVSYSDANITADKSSATIDDKVNLTIKDRTSEGYKLDKVLVNSTEIAVQDFKASFDMKDYMKDVTITAQYSKIPYTITTDEFSQVANSTATAADVINVTFKQLDGYNLTSATYNGNALSISDYKSSFTMPAANVEIKAVYAPIAYDVSCADANITVDKTTATIEDKVNLTFKNRTSEGYKLDKVLVNSTEIAVKDFKASFDMKDYLKDVTISAQYSQIAYTITTDEYSQVAKTTATVDDAVTVTFKQREGFDLVSATYNGNKLIVNNYKASFTMPAQDVEIKTVYTEKEYEIAKPSEDVQISQPTAKAGDEINIIVTIKDGYTAHLYVNGQEVALNGNLANYIMPSGKIEIKVEYVANPKTPVSEIYSDNCAVSVFPNPAKSGEKITLKVGGKFDTNNTKIYIYNASGSIVMQIDNVKEDNQLTLKSGVYVGVLVSKGGKKTFRVAVK